MIRIRRLYSEPKIFEPISFESGINIILGEKSEVEVNDKTNGVGKSVCIEFLNFCLLKKTSDSRVMRIPNTVFDIDTKIKLDLQIHGQNLTITRTKAKPEKISIHKNGEEIVFDTIDEASKYLGNLYFEKYDISITRLSFRSLLAPIIRDERSEFKDIIKCFDTDKTIPRDFIPHLFFLNLNIELYIEIKKIIDDLAKKTDYLRETKKLITNNQEVSIKDAKARYNELESEVSRINQSIEQLKNKESFDIIQNDIVLLESKLNRLRIQQKAIKYEIKQINSLPTPENISENEMVILFNQFKKGLGDIVQKSLEEVKIFRNKIDSFRNTLINKKLENLRDELLKINQQVEILDNQYSEKMRLIDSSGEIVRHLKVSINIFTKKNEELNNLRFLIDRYDTAEKDKKNLISQKGNKILEFDSFLTQKSIQIKSFEETILQIHEKIIGNRKAHFDIAAQNTSGKEFLNFDLRIDDDGSYSVERIKVFIYDNALMFNEFTSKNHPRFLVHDNIFNIDDDSLEKCLNYLYQQEQNHPEEFQYILTLNRDMIEKLEIKEKLAFKIEEYRRAYFTKEKRFLAKYVEEKKK